jgi:hypothetical protein
MRELLSISLIGLFLVGCSPAHKRNKQWKNDFTYIKMIRKTFDESATLNFSCDGYERWSSTAADAKKTKKRQSGGVNAFNWVDQVHCYMQDPNKTPVQKAELRNWVIESFVTFVNHAYGDFEHDSVFFRESNNAALDAINLGLTAGTSVFGGTALGAASTGAQGFQHSVDKNFYNSETAFVINGKMQALRLEQLTRIREREVLPVECPAPAAPKGSTQDKGSQPQCYTFSEAMNDVQELFYSGTVHRALQDISNQTSAQTTEAQNKLKTLNTQDVPSSKNTTGTTEEENKERGTQPKPNKAVEPPKM